jgi:hypothetical protein
VDNISTICSCRHLYKYKVKIVHILIGWVCCGLLGRQVNFGMTWLVWGGEGAGVVKVCNASTQCLVWVLWEYSSAGRRNSFIIWPMEGRPVQAFELFWRGVLSGRLVESIDYLLLIAPDDPQGHPFKITTK